MVLEPFLRPVCFFGGISTNSSIRAEGASKCTSVGFLLFNGSILVPLDREISTYVSTHSHWKNEKKSYR